MQVTGVASHIRGTWPRYAITTHNAPSNNYSISWAYPHTLAARSEGQEEKWWTWTVSLYELEYTLKIGSGRHYVRVTFRSMERNEWRACNEVEVEQFENNIHCFQPGRLNYEKT